MKSKNKRIVNCNERLVRETAEALREQTKIVRQLASDYTKFIADLLMNETLEGAILPYLGKIRIKTKQIQYKSIKRPKRALIKGGVAQYLIRTKPKAP